MSHLISEQYLRLMTNQTSHAYMRSSFIWKYPVGVGFCCITTIYCVFSPQFFFPHLLQILYSHFTSHLNHMQIMLLSFWNLNILFLLFIHSFLYVYMLLKSHLWDLQSIRIHFCQLLLWGDAVQWLSRSVSTFSLIQMNATLKFTVIDYRTQANSESLFYVGKTHTKTV